MNPPFRTISLPKWFAFAVVAGALLTSATAVGSADADGGTRSSITLEYLSEADRYTVKSAMLPDDISVTTSKETAAGTTRICLTTNLDRIGFDVNDLQVYAVTKLEKRIPATKLIRHDEERKKGISFIAS